MPSHEYSPKEVNKIVSQRKTAEFFLRALLPSRIHDAFGTLRETHEQVASGKGLLIISNHFSMRDGPQVFYSIPGKDEMMMERRWTAPIAKHQYPIANFIDKFLHLHLELKPVVTNDTYRKHPEEVLGEGLREYLRSSVETLQTGGILVLFPQSERQSLLIEPDAQKGAMSLLAAMTVKANVPDFAILPIGFGIAGVEDYKNVRGANIGKTYDVAVGKLWTRESMMSDAAVSGMTLDQWAYGQLKPLVPDSYKSSGNT